MAQEPSNPRILLVRCSADKATEITRKWADGVEDALRLSPFSFTDLAGEEASPRRFVEAIQDLDPGAIFLFDHGHPRELLGERAGQLTPLLGFHNAHLTRGRIVWTLACWSAAQLGPECVYNHGCLAYEGYNTAYSYYRIEPYFNSFRDCAVESFLKLVGGDTTGQAHDSARQKRQGVLDEWRLLKDGKTNLIGASLRDNMLHHVLLGSRDIRLHR